jgi:hypothetical protein
VKDKNPPRLLFLRGELKAFFHKSLPLIKGGWEGLFNKIERGWSNPNKVIFVLSVKEKKIDY